MLAHKKVVYGCLRVVFNLWQSGLARLTVVLTLPNQKEHTHLFLTLTNQLMIKILVHFISIICQIKVIFYFKINMLHEVGYIIHGIFWQNRYILSILCTILILFNIEDFHEHVSGVLWDWNLFPTSCTILTYIITRYKTSLHCWSL